ncbi:MAG: PAS domain-containing protein, partial [Candidatus Sericytochromatia bacterium]
APALSCAQHGPDHVYTFTNPIYNQVLGNRPLVGLPIREALPEVAGQGFFELLDGVYQTGEPFLGNEMPIMIDRRGDGALEQAYFNFVYAAMRKDDGSIDGILTHAVEVTDMVLARQQVQRSEDRFRSLVRATSQLVWITDAAGLVEDIPEWRAYTGQSQEEVRGYGWLEALHPDDRPRAEAAWRSAVAGEGPYEVEYRIRAQDGTYQTFVARGTPVLESEGSVREWVGLCVNIEEQRRIEAENERLFASSLDVICTVGADGYIKRTNPTFSRLLGYPDEVLLATPFIEFVHPDDREATAAEAEKLAGGGTTINFENRYLAADGSVRWFNWTCNSDVATQLFFCIARDVTDQRAAAQALRDRETQYAMVMKATQDAIWDWNLLTNHVAWNDGVETLFHYTPNQVEQTAAWWYDHIHPEDAERVVTGIHAVIDHGGQNWTDEYRYRKADGTYALVVDRGYCIHDEAGRPVRMVGAMHDVTRVREAEAELKASEARFRVLADAMPQQVWTATPDGLLDYVNAQVRAYAGRPAEDLLGDRWATMVHPDDLPAAAAAGGASLPSGAPYAVFFRLLHAESDVYRWHVGRALPIRDAEGRILHWYGTNTDFHDQKVIEMALQQANESLASQQEELQAQQEELQMQTEELQSQQLVLAEINRDLSQSEARFRELADAMPQIVWTAVADGSLDYYNQRWFDYTGLTLEQTRGWGWDVVLHPDDLARTVDTWKECLATGKPYFMEYRFKRGEDGAYRWHLGRAVPVRDAEGRAVKWYGTNTDIHDQKMAELALQHANEALASQQEELQMQTEELQSQQLALEQINRDLHDSEERISQLANVMPAIVWAADPQGRQDYYNDHTTLYTGRAIERLIDEGWQSVIQPDDLPGTLAAWARCVVTGEPLDHEFRVFHAESGEHRWHIGRAVAIRDDKGRVVRWQGTCTDIDDQKRIGESLQLANEELVRLSAQAQAANKMKSEFLANMSHELRTPLNSIIGYTELVVMLGSAGLGETERSNLDVVLRNARHLLSLINDVLDLSKIEAGKASVHAEPFDPRALVEAVIGTAAPMAQEKGLRIA